MTIVSKGVTVSKSPLYVHLDDVYRKRSKYCVIFISAHCGAKLWTSHERQSAQARVLESAGEYVLPVRFDDTEIPGVRPTTGYLDLLKMGPDELAHALADGDLIVRVTQNLLGNALKFSGRGSTVLIRATVSGDRAMHAAADAAVALQPGSFVSIAVVDCGVGIAPEDQEMIFAKFGQVGERRGGSGLGLTFCKLVVEAHGGQIWVDSKVGEGSTFFFTLPTVA